MSQFIVFNLKLLTVLFNKNIQRKTFFKRVKRTVSFAHLNYLKKIKINKYKFRLIYNNSVANELFSKNRYKIFLTHFDYNTKKSKKIHFFNKKYNNIILPLSKFSIVKKLKVRKWKVFFLPAEKKKKLNHPSFFKFNKNIKFFRKILKKIKKKKLNNFFFLNIWNKLKSINIIYPQNHIFSYLYLNNKNLDKYLINFFSKRLFNHNLIPKFSLFNTDKINYNWLFFNKSNSLFFKNKEKLSKFFTDMNKNKLTLYRNARNLHWKYYQKKKIVKEYRYKIFLKSKIKNQKKKITPVYLYLISQFNLSYNFWKNYQELYNSFFLKSVKTSIFQLPLCLDFWIWLQVFIHKKLKISNKIKNWFYKKRIINKTFWMNKKKKIPNFFFKNNIYIKNPINNIQLDPLTNYFIMLKKKDLCINLDNFILKNKYLKSHNFRYKA